MDERRVFAVVVVLWAAAATAQDTWSDPFPGVRHLHRVLPDQNINAALVNLCADGVSVRVTASSERGRRTSAFGSSVGAQLAVNGDFFEFGSYRTDGYTLHDGQAWPDTSDHNQVGQLAFGAERVEAIHHAAVITPAGWMKEVISGHWTLVDNGVYEDNSGDVGTHPRTALGLTKDRRTLILLVVDGRNLAAGRRGMSFPELTAQLQSLGAHWALALDGGGSSTMWLAGRGVVNHPSDGSERTVANHLAVYATGQGAPAHCDRSVEEALFTFPTAQDGQSSDVDGDGVADACARDKDGVVCATSSGQSFRAPFRGPALSDAANWWWPTLGLSLRTGDLDGDGKADVCARNGDGLHCWRSNGAGFDAQEWTLPLTDAAGWGDLDNVATLMLGDVTGDGKADVCARGNDAVYCWPSTGQGFGPPMQAAGFGDADGFTDYSTFGTLRLADVNGDGKLDVCGRSHVRLVCRLSDGQGFPTRVDGPVFTSFVGFGELRFWSTLRVTDVNGDGKADACIRTSTEYRCHLSKGDAFEEQPVLGPPLMDLFGWGLHRFYSTVRFLDLDGDGDQDLCARAVNGVLCWKWEGQGFAKDPLDGPALSDASGWGDIAYYPSLRAADVNGDGKEDLCAKSAFGLHCWLSDGNGFPTQVNGPAWAGADWHWLLHSPSLRLATPPRRPEVCNGKDDDRDGQVDEGCGIGAPLGSDADATLGGGPGGSPGSGGSAMRPVPGEVVGSCAQVPAGALPLLALGVLGGLRRRRSR